MHLGAVAKGAGTDGSAERIRLQPIARIAAGLLMVRAALWVSIEPYWALADVALVAVALVTDRILSRANYTARAVELAAIGLGGLTVCGSLLRVDGYQESSEAAVVAATILGAAYVLRGDVGFYSFSGSILFAWLGTASSTQMSPTLLAQTSTALLAVLGLAVWMRAKIGREQSEASRAMDLDRQYESERQRIADSLGGSGVGLWYWDLKGRRFSASSQWTDLLGLDCGGWQDVNPQQWFSRVHPYYEADLQAAVTHHLEKSEEEHFEYQYRIQHEDGDYRWVQVRGTAIRNANGEAVAVAGGQLDASHLVDAENRMMQDALHDRLTGLPNRQAFMMRLRRAFEELQQDSEHRFAVIFLDVNRFKAINDSRGHLVGDRLLAVMASRLRESIKATDIVARFGGDEFVALIEPVRAPNRALAVAERFQERLSAPIEVGGEMLTTGVSVGIAIAGPNTESIEDILRDADTAMYRAKAAQNGRVAMFKSEMHSEAAERSQLQNDLTEAVDRDELMLYYQPVYATGTGRIVAAEALLRWRRDDDTFVSPGEFIPLAEELGLIEVLGEWVLRSACGQAAEWRRAGLPQIRMSVNVSAKQMRTAGFSERVRTIVEEAGLDAKQLELELTESAVVDSLESAPGLLDEIRAAGVRVSVDDFGAGYAAFGYLRSQDFDTVKIDKCFVSGVGKGGKSDAITRGLVQTAHGLDLRVIAEGVESAEQVQFLRGIGCNALQGFLLGRPVAAEDFRKLLAANGRLEDRLKRELDVVA